MARLAHRPTVATLLGLTAGTVLLSATGAAAESGCADLFPAGATVTMTGKTIPGERNKTSELIEFRLSAVPSSASGVALSAGRIDAGPLKNGTVTWNAGAQSRWGNRCMDAVAPDGRRWSFLALNWENENAHPNLHAVVDWADGSADIVGFLDNKSGAFHEAQVILTSAPGTQPIEVEHLSDGARETGRSSLCRALFRGDKGHFFVGTDYATGKDKSPGHLAMTLEPARHEPGQMQIGGRFIATEGPKRLETHVIDPQHSACINLPDPRYAMLQLRTAGGVEMIVWLWGEDNVPQKNDRLMGYITFPGSSIVRSKVALWRL